MISLFQFILASGDRVLHYKISKKWRIIHLFGLNDFIILNLVKMLNIETKFWSKINYSSFYAEDNIFGQLTCQDASLNKNEEKKY